MIRTCVLMAVAALLAGCSLLPANEAQREPVERPSAGAALPAPAGSQCMAALGRTGAAFSALPNAYTGPGCSQIDAVQLRSLRGDDQDLTLTNIGPVHCKTAAAFAGWARYGVGRAAQQHLGSGLARIETFGSYSCRNIAGSSRRSAHSRAEAIDVSAFVLKDGRRISIASGWNTGSKGERAFLRAIRKSACRRFGTVLSPDYNAAHADHLHLETGGRSFCR